MSASLLPAEYHLLRNVLVSARLRLQLPRAALAARLRSSILFVTSYECGDRRLDVAEFFRVCEALEVKPAEVLAKAWIQVAPPPPANQLLSNRRIR